MDEALEQLGYKTCKYYDVIGPRAWSREQKVKKLLLSVYLFNLYFFLDMLFYFQFSLNWISNFLKAD